MSRHWVVLSNCISVMVLVAISSGSTVPRSAVQTFTTNLSCVWKWCTKYGVLEMIYVVLIFRICGISLASDFGKLLGEQSSPRWEIPCLGRRWTTVQNLMLLALSSAEKCITVQTHTKKCKQMVSYRHVWIIIGISLAAARGDWLDILE